MGEGEFVVCGNDEKSVGGRSFFVGWGLVVFVFSGILALDIANFCESVGVRARWLLFFVVLAGKMRL